MKPKISITTTVSLVLIGLTLFPFAAWSQKTSIRQMDYRGFYCRGPCTKESGRMVYDCKGEYQTDDYRSACSPIGKDWFGLDCQIDSPCAKGTNSLYPDQYYCRNVLGDLEWCSTFEYDSLKEFDYTYYVCASPCQMGDDGHFYCATQYALQSPCSPSEGLTTEDAPCTSKCDWFGGGHDDMNFPWSNMWCYADMGDHSWWGDCSLTRENSENSLQSSQSLSYAQPEMNGNNNNTNNGTRVYEFLRQVLNTANRLRVLFTINYAGHVNFWLNLSNNHRKLAHAVLAAWRAGGYKLTESTSTIIAGVKNGIRLDVQGTFTEAGRFFYHIQLQVNDTPEGVKSTVAQLFVDSAVILTRRYLIYGLSYSMNTRAPVRIQQEPT